MSFRDARWFAEDMVKLGRWLVRESRDELHSRFWKAVEGVDSRLAPKHVQRGWDAVLAEEEASRDSWEPGEASLLSWGVDGATTEPPLGHASSTEVFEDRAYSGHDPRDPDCEFDPWDEVALDYDARCPICSRVAETSVAASATEGPTGVEHPPLAPPVGPPPGEGWTEFAVNDLEPRTWVNDRTGEICREAYSEEALQLLKEDPNEYFRRTRPRTREDRIASSGGVTQLHRVVDLVNSGASPERIREWCQQQIAARK